MSYYRHHAIVVTGQLPDHIKAAHALAERVFADSYIKVSPVMASGLNNQTTFFCVAPDGSSETFPDSDEMDLLRAAFLDELDHAHAANEFYTDYVEVTVGDEGTADRVTRSNNWSNNYHNEERP